MFLVINLCFLHIKQTTRVVCFSRPLDVIVHFIDVRECFSKACNKLLRSSKLPFSRHPKIQFFLILLSYLQDMTRLFLCLLFFTSRGLIRFHQMISDLILDFVLQVSAIARWSYRHSSRIGLLWCIILCYMGLYN